MDIIISIIISIIIIVVIVKIYIINMSNISFIHIYDMKILRTI